MKNTPPDVHSYREEIAKPSFIIEEAHLFALWEKKDINTDDVCAICLVQLSEMCTDCQSKVTMRELYKRRKAQETQQADTHDSNERWIVDDSELWKEKRAQCPMDCGKCSHKFHTHCLSQWLRTQPTCPLDKKRWESKFE